MKKTTCNPNKPLAPRTADTLDSMKDMLTHENYARVKAADKNRLRAQAGRKGYKWAWKKERQFYIVTVIK